MTSTLPNFNVGQPDLHYYEKQGRLRSEGVNLWRALELYFQSLEFTFGKANPAIFNACDFEGNAWNKTISGIDKTSYISVVPGYIGVQIENRASDPDLVEGKLIQDTFFEFSMSLEGINKAIEQVNELMIQLKVCL